MQETSNYKLNQWESTDRILMDNFNEDNRAIDKELAAQEKRIAAVESGKEWDGSTYWVYEDTPELRLIASTFKTLEAQLKELKEARV